MTTDSVYSEKWTPCVFSWCRMIIIIVIVIIFSMKFLFLSASSFFPGFSHSISLFMTSVWMTSLVLTHKESRALSWQYYHASFMTRIDSLETKVQRQHQTREWESEEYFFLKRKLPKIEYKKYCSFSDERQKSWLKVRLEGKMEYIA